MSTYDLYTTPVEPGTWDVPAAGAARFSCAMAGRVSGYQRGILSKRGFQRAR